MLRQTFSRWLSFAFIAVIVLAIWKVNNGNMSNIVDTVWGLLNKGADIVVNLWHNISSIGNGK